MAELCSGSASNPTDHVDGIDGQLEFDIGGRTCYSLTNFTIWAYLLMRSVSCVVAKVPPDTHSAPMLRIR